MRRVGIAGAWRCCNIQNFLPRLLMCIMLLMTPFANGVLAAKPNHCINSDENEVRLLV